MNKLLKNCETPWEICTVWNKFIKNEETRKFLDPIHYFLFWKYIGRLWDPCDEVSLFSKKFRILQFYFQDRSFLDHPVWSDISSKKLFQQIFIKDNLKSSSSSGIGGINENFGIENLSQIIESISNLSISMHSKNLKSDHNLKLRKIAQMFIEENNFKQIVFVESK